MSAFGDYAEIYWELGYSIIPIRKGEKRPFLDYSKYRDKQCSRSQLDQWIKKYPDGNIAIVPGPASGLCMFDIDIKNQPKLLAKALQLAPRSPLERFGSKGLGIIVKYDGQIGRKLYYKNKEIGEMIVNTVFVIPPSIHPDTGKPYEWTGYLSLDAELKEDILNEIPCPSDADIAAFEVALNDGAIEVDEAYFKEVTGRNNKLKAICGSMISKGMLPEEMAPLLMTEDLLLNGDKALFSDPKEFKSSYDNPIANAYMFASSIFRTFMKQSIARKQEVPHFDKKKVIEAKENVEYTKYKLFFEKVLKSCKRDRIDGVLKKKDMRGFWQPVGNNVNAMKSLGTDYGLSPNRMSFHFGRYEKQAKPEFLYKLPQWDGEDHIGNMVSHIKCSNMEPDEVLALFKQWLVRAFRRPMTGEQNTMIVLQGGQGVGKDVFVENLCGGFAPYFANFTDATQEKDMFMQVAKNMIINISEFDKLNKKHPGMVKDLISRKTAQFRPSHQQHFEDFAMNASFIGSVNPKDFLTDHTGNRRFWVFEDVEIDWEYKKGLGAQILAQTSFLNDKAYEAPKEVVLKMNAHVGRMGPESLDDMITGIWNDSFDEAVRFGQKFGQKSLRYNDVETAMLKVQKFTGMRSLKKVQQALKRLGAQRRTGKERLYQRIEIQENPENSH